jgi:hypothetical protein
MPSIESKQMIGYRMVRHGFPGVTRQSIGSSSTRIVRAAGIGSASVRVGLLRARNGCTQVVMSAVKFCLA